MSTVFIIVRVRIWSTLAERAQRVDCIHRMYGQGWVLQLILRGQEGEAEKSDGANDQIAFGRKIILLTLHNHGIEEQRTTGSQNS